MNSKSIGCTLGVGDDSKSEHCNAKGLILDLRSHHNFLESPAWMSVYLMGFRGVRNTGMLEKLRDPRAHFQLRDPRGHFLDCFPGRWTASWTSASLHFIKIDK